MRRRTMLASLAAGAVGAAAGCGAFADDTRSPGEGTPESYDRLAAQRVYLAPAVSLRLPEATTRVDSPADATLVVVPDDTDVAAERAVDWLASGVGVALVGPDAQATFLEWRESDAYAERFDSGGVGVGSPPADFLVAFGIDGQYVSKYTYRWEDTSDPGNDRYLGAIKSALEDVSER